MTVLLAAVALVTSGCAKTYLGVVSDWASAFQSPPARVTATPAYRQALAGVKSVAIRLPDSCLNASGGANATAAVQSGMALQSSVILNSVCGVWLAELERALAERAYQVISWDALYRLERQDSLSTYAAAQRLKADAVFVVNSFEYNDVGADARTGGNLQYFRSNSRGSFFEEQPLDQRQREIIRDIVTARSGSSSTVNGTIGLGATMDATAILSGSGEAFWFYQRSVTRPYAESVSRRFLLRGRDVYWRPVLPRGADFRDVEQKQYATSDSYHSSTQGGVSDVNRREQLKVARIVMADLVNSFATGSM
jgi:hypothetical protein